MRIGPPDEPGRRPALAGAVAAVRLLAGGACGAALLTVLQVPAGSLVGAVVGSALANRLPPAPAPRSPVTAIRVVGLVLLGCVAGARLDASTLRALAGLAVPLVVAVAALMLLNVALAAILIRWWAIDAPTAILTCAPGGVSEIALTAEQLGARLGVVLAVHAVRVIVVVLLVLPIVVALVPRS